jgi:hypothetical protein
MNPQVRGCVGYVLLFCIFIVSAVFGTAVGVVGWILPSVLIAVGFMVIQMLIDAALLAMGSRDLGDLPPETLHE